MRRRRIARFARDRKPFSWILPTLAAAGTCVLTSLVVFAGGKETTRRLRLTNEAGVRLLVNGPTAAARQTA
jgi:hypothetical protein